MMYLSIGIKKVTNAQLVFKKNRLEFHKTIGHLSVALNIPLDKIN